MKKALYMVALGAISSVNVFAAKPLNQAVQTDTSKVKPPGKKIKTHAVKAKQDSLKKL